MIRYSVIIPQHDRPDEVRRQLPRSPPRLIASMIPTKSSSSTTARRLPLAACWKNFCGVSSLPAAATRSHVGVSVALTAGIQAARGEVSSPWNQAKATSPNKLRSFVEGLQRADMMPAAAVRPASRKRGTASADCRAGCSWAWTVTILIACFGPPDAKLCRH